MSEADPIGYDPLPYDPAPLDPVDASRAPLMEHLIELRRRLLWSVAAIAVGFGVCLYFAKPIFVAAAGSGISASSVGTGSRGSSWLASSWTNAPAPAGPVRASPSPNPARPSCVTPGTRS